MADQQNRPRIFGKPLLQQVQCLQIQIVGRLIKHQQIGWQSKSTRQGGARLVEVGSVRAAKRWLPAPPPRPSVIC